MKKCVVYYLLYLLLLPACNVSETTAQEVLSAEGLHGIHLTGYAFFSCSEDDNFKSHFTAKRWTLQEDGNRIEANVTGTLCCGLLKGCTVRY